MDKAQEKEVFDGLYKRYHNNGKLFEEGNLKKGKKWGLWKLYSKDGKSRTESYYKDDELV